MERIIKAFCYLFRRKHGIYLRVQYEEELQPFLIKNKKYFSLFLFYKGSGIPVLKYND